MARFVKGEVVVVPFPFSALSKSKRRPALVLAELAGDDRILCQITSRHLRDSHAIALDDADFDKGSLHQPSYIRPNRLFTADSHIILYSAGRLKADKLAEVLDKVVEILRR